MKIELTRHGRGFHLEAVNESGNSVQMDASPDIGGEGKGARPMELLAMALGGCSTIDVISILKKQKQDLQDISVTVEGRRAQGQVPSLFETLHVHFKLKGPVEKEKAARAVQLSMEKYCSVAKTLEMTAKITYDYSLEP